MIRFGMLICIGPHKKCVAFDWDDEYAGLIRLEVPASKVVVNLGFECVTQVEMNGTSLAEDV